MKKIVLLLFSFLFISGYVLAQDINEMAPAVNSTLEIDKVFNDSINYKKEKKSIFSKKKDVSKSVNAQSSDDLDIQIKKETVKTNSSKELKEQLKKEDEKRRYRELEDLTELSQQAIALYSDNNLDEALNVFSKIPEDKRTPELWLLMGNIFMDKGKNDEAVFMYGRAVLVEPTFYKAYYNLGNIYLSEDKFNMAVEQYKQAIKYNPNNAFIHYNLGCAYIKLGDLKKAKCSFIRAIELKNNVSEFHYNLAFVFKKLGKEKQAKIYLDNYNKLTGEI